MKMIDPYDMPEESACGPTSPPSLQSDSAEDIVRALADTPNSWTAKVLYDLDALVVRARIWRAKNGG